MEQRRTLRDAIAAIEAGDQITGRRTLSDILRFDPTCAEAWLWMSRIAENESQRHEYLCRALSPRDGTAAGSVTVPNAAQIPEEQILSSSLTPTEVPPPAASGVGCVDQSPVLTTRKDLWDPTPLLTEEQRQKGQRNVMLAGAMSLSLFCGVALLVYLALTIVPAAHERTQQRYVSTPYPAVIWCPSCEQSGQPIILRDRPRRLFSGAAGTLDHGTVVTVVGEEWATLEGRVYVHVQIATASGWVRATDLKR